MSGLKEIGGLYGMSQAGQKVAPDELDVYTQYIVTHPGLLTTSLGTAESASPVAITFTNVTPDYPRNVLFSILGVAGGMGGTVVVNGRNQFGEAISETMSLGTANGGGTVAGTKVFARLSSATVTPVGLGGTAIGTARLGYAVGTAAGIVAKLGMPVKLGAVSDIRSVTRSGQGVGGSAINGGTVTSAHVDLVNHAYLSPAILGGSEIYTFTIKSTFDNSGKADLTRTY